MTDLRNIIPNASAAELELVARYAMLPEDARRKRAFDAFAVNGLPHRRMEAWKWTDFKAALTAIETPENKAADDPFAGIEAYTIRVDQGRMAREVEPPAGVRMFDKAEAQAFAGAEDLPLGAMTAALAGQKGGINTLLIEVTEPVATPLRFVFAADGDEANFARVTVLVRPGASVELVESHLGGAGFSSSLLDLSVQPKGRATRTVFQRGGLDEAQAITATVHLDERAVFDQTVLAFGAKVSRIETRVSHQETGAKAVLNAAYLAGAGAHVDLTSHVRHSAASCVTRQATKGAVLDGGRGVFQGKFHVPRRVGQFTDADMQHNALLLEDGAEVFAKPELEIYADDVECAHGNTCGALDENQLFYMRQRGIPEADAKALLTEAFVAEAFDSADEALRGILQEEARAWLSASR